MTERVTQSTALPTRKLTWAVIAGAAGNLAMNMGSKLAEWSSWFDWLAYAESQTALQIGGVTAFMAIIGYFVRERKP